MNGTLREQQVIDQRMTMYQLLEAPFVFPDENRTQSFIDGTWQQRMVECADGLGFRLPESGALCLTANAKDFEIEFISLFEVGMGGAPCPLHSGHYGRDRLSTMEEVLRFYRFFDFYPDRSADRFPDHINFELQFMVHLCQAFRDALTSGGDLISPLLAQRDFIQRNLVSWLPQLDQLIGKKANIDFFKQASRITSDFITFDNEMLNRIARETEISNPTQQSKEIAQ